MMVTQPIQQRSQLPLMEWTTISLQLMTPMLLTRVQPFLEVQEQATILIAMILTLMLPQANPLLPSDQGARKVLVLQEV